MMRAAHVVVVCGALGVAFAIAITAPLGCSSVARYPACERDEQCAVSAKHDYCVSGRCVYCRTSSDCGDRERCRAGACEVDPNAPLPSVLDAGDDSEAGDDGGEDEAGEEPDDDPPARSPESHRHVIPPGVRRFLRP